MKKTNTTKAITYIVIILLLNSTTSFSQSNNTEKQKGRVLFTDFLSTKNDTILIDDKMGLFYFFRVLNCLSGDMYFVIDGFNSVRVVPCNVDENTLKAIFEKCVPGSKIVLENCSIPRDGGLKPIILNKTILFK